MPIGQALSATDSSSFELKVKADPQGKTPGTYLVELKRKKTADEGSVGEVVIWWTLPGGKKTSITMKQVMDGAWANRIVLDAPAGKNQLVVVVLEKDGEGKLARTTELDYELDLPGINLKRIEVPPAKAKEEKPLAAAADKKNPAISPSHLRESGWSLPVIVILVSVTNLILLLSGLLAFKFFRMTSLMKFAGAGAGADPVLSEIFSAAGLIDGQTGAPLPCDPGMAEAAGEVLKDGTGYGELFEQTVAYAGGEEREILKSSAKADEDKENKAPAPEEGPKPSGENIDAEAQTVIGEPLDLKNLSF